MEKIEKNMKGNQLELNNRGNYEINLQVRRAEQSYQRGMQEMVAYSPKRLSSMAVTSRGTIFKSIFGSILAYISKPIGKRLHLSRDGWKEAPAAQQSLR